MKVGNQKDCLQLLLIKYKIKMSKKKVKESCVKAPWGKIALVTWGNSNNPPVLLVHGYMDTAATFNYLVDQLPDNHYYVGLDIPGHGKSDPFPPGMLVTQLHVVEIIKIVVEHFKWKRFIYMAHSMGCVIGLFYHHIYPDFIRKIIFLDVILPLEMYHVADKKQAIWFQAVYSDYYTNYQKWNSGKPRLHTLDSAISLLVRNRNLTEEQAEEVLSRSLVPMGIDSYKLSWDPRMKKIAQLPIPDETLYTIMTENFPPTLLLDASESLIGDRSSKKFAENLLQKCEQTLPNFFRITVTGGHDVHITNPEYIAPHVDRFLNSKERSLNRVFRKKCKL